MSLTSCSDFFDVNPNNVVDANKDLNNRTDTLYSMVGILNKLQAIADRTVLLGEARGDLMNITDAASSDLRDLALFDVKDDNQYNSPAEYYAIINNCNFFIAHADTAVKNNRNEHLFKSEYNAVKAIRAWTYLQLVTTYGKVPFFTQPVLTEDEGDLSKYPKYGIREVCDYFVNQDGLTDIVRSYSPTMAGEVYQPEIYNYPGYGMMQGINSRNFFFPLRIVLADLYLWLASCTNDKQDYLNAATYYYQYITMRNGSTTTRVNPYTLGQREAYWYDDSWMIPVDNYTRQFGDVTYNQDSEIITLIPTDSIESDGHYSQLRNIFCTYPYSEKYEASLVPSQSLKDLSAAQTYYHFQGGKASPAPKSMSSSVLVGDLRLSTAWDLQENHVEEGRMYNRQNINKITPSNRNSRLHVKIYRRTLLYLRLAEAMNRAGYPDYAFHILATGLNKTMVKDSIATRYVDHSVENPDLSDSIMLVDKFGFSNEYTLVKKTKENEGKSSGNTMGIHSRGSGYTPDNVEYVMPTGTLEEKIRKVEDMIVDEEALEFAFEGYRYYDLLRVAIRRNDDNYLQQKIGARNGSGATDLRNSLTDRKNWFLNWKGQIGY